MRDYTTSRSRVEWLFLAVMRLGYAILTQVVKSWFIRKFGE